MTRSKPNDAAPAALFLAVVGILVGLGGITVTVILSGNEVRAQTGPFVYFTVRPPRRVAVDNLQFRTSDGRVIAIDDLSRFPLPSDLLGKSVAIFHTPTETLIHEWTVPARATILDLRTIEWTGADHQ